MTAGVIYEIFGQIPPIVTIGTLESGANIGVSVYDMSIVDESISSAVGVFATNDSETDVQYFTADNTRTYIEFDSESNSLKLSHNPETIFVTDNSDYKTNEPPVEGSLRHATANAIEGDTVKFNLPEDDRTILIKSPYTVTKSIIIDGSSGITIDGDNTKVPASLTTDLEGNNRIVNDIVDLGCYETPVQEVAINIYDNPMGYGEVKIKDNTTGNYLDEDGRQHIKIGTSVTIEATTFNESGFAFAGWFNKATGEYFSKTQKFTFDAKENLELEARFTDSVIWIRVKKGN